MGLETDKKFMDKLGQNVDDVTLNPRSGGGREGGKKGRKVGRKEGRKERGKGGR